MPLSGKATVDAMADQWAKFLAIYMHREHIAEIVIAAKDVSAIMEDVTAPTIVVQELQDGLHIRLLPRLAAIGLAQKIKGASESHERTYQRD